MAHARIHTTTAVHSGSNSKSNTQNEKPIPRAERNACFRTGESLLENKIEPERCELLLSFTESLFPILEYREVQGAEAFDST